MEKKRMAIIDLGSSSVRLILMQVNADGSYKLIQQAKEMVRLCEGMGREKILRQEAVQRTVHTLHLFKKIMEAHQVDKVYAVATAAVREAKNRQEFLELVVQETGMFVKVITGLKEAYYGFLGAINTLPVEDCLIIDIGGASTEIVWVEKRQKKEAVSLPFGAVTLTDDFLDKDLISQEKFTVLKNYLGSRFQGVPWLKDDLGLPVVGLGGTIRTLSSIHRKIREYPLSLVHHYEMNYQDIVSITKKLPETTFEERCQISGFKKERADIAAAGFVVLEQLMFYVQSTHLIISGNGLREGLFFEDYLGSEKILTDVLTKSIDNILKRYSVNRKHSYHVQKLSLRLFDETQQLHNLDEKARKLLSVASLLHDIGIYVDYYNHHKHGFYLVLNSHLKGLNHKELLMCAFIVGMHRFEKLKIKWQKYRTLIAKHDYKLIKKLSLFLRIAESLDKNHSGVVEDVTSYQTADRVEFILLTREAAELELSTAIKNKRHFEKYFKRSFSISTQGAG